MRLFPFRFRKGKDALNGSARGNGREAEFDDDEPVGGEGWLSTHEVKKSYRSQMVVKGVSLAASRGEAVGLLGPNGAGKTTLFYMIMGLVAADAGRVMLDGRDVTRLPMYRRARLGIGYLPQEQSIFRGLSTEQNIMAVLELVEPQPPAAQGAAGCPAGGIRHRAEAQVPSLALSGGERRRVRDRPRPGHRALVHAAGRAVRRRRPAGG